ncbi:AMP-binding protein [Halorubrum sp. DTA98]|uniref:AMP-binding protein n=1 Tax=Halorubrum sp. DTA98 TaxID=3402163 RepID=UPI003AAC30E9
MDVVGDLLARERRSRDLALVTREGSERSYHDVITNAYKAANVLRHLGAREGSTVAVAPEPSVHTTLAFLGAARLGACVRFDPEAGLDAGDRVALVPVAEEPDRVPSPGTNLAVFGGPPARAGTTHWEAELWSENPGTPPSTVGADDPVIVSADGTVSHRDVLSAAREVVEAFGLDDSSRVVVRTSFAEPGTIAVGVVAPLVSGGATVLAGTDPSGTDAASRGDLAVVPGVDAGGPETVPEPRRIDPVD